MWIFYPWLHYTNHCTFQKNKKGKCFWHVWMHLCNQQRKCVWQDVWLCQELVCCNKTCLFCFSSFLILSYVCVYLSVRELWWSKSFFFLCRWYVYMCLLRGLILYMYLRYFWFMWQAFWHISSVPFVINIFSTYE